MKKLIIVTSLVIIEASNEVLVFGIPGQGQKTDSLKLEAEFPILQVTVKYCKGN